MEKFPLCLVGDWVVLKLSGRGTTGMPLPYDIACQHEADA